MTQLVTFGEALLRFSPPTGSRLAMADSYTVHVGGAEGNVAVAACQTGVDTCWISTLPDTPLGRRIQHTYNQVGLQTDITWTDGGRVGTYYIEFGAAPRETRVLYDREHTPIATSTPQDISTERIQEADIFSVSGITPALSTQLRDTTGSLLEVAKDHGTKTVFDLNFRANLWTPASARRTIDRLLPYVDVFVISERDAASVFDLQGEGESIVRTLASRYQLDTVLLTRGNQGAMGLDQGKFASQAAYTTETIDPIGSGDAFLGGYLTRDLEGAVLHDRLAFANATAALKRTIRGDMVLTTREEIDRIVTGTESGIQR